MKKSSADFDLSIKETEAGNIFIVIHDLNLGKISVTNDMENILFDLANLTPYLEKMNIIYEDSSGVFDGVSLTENGHNFFHIGATNEKEAIRKVESQLSKGVASNGRSNK